MPANTILLHLQVILLKAVLLGQPLPGQPQPIRFPDLSFITRQPTILLARKNLVGPIYLKELPKPLQTISAEALLRESQTHGNVAYLQFQRPEVMDNTVGLTLEAKIATRDPDQKELGLSSIYVKFLKLADEWKVIDEPVYFAA